jgi:hypothetical protein
MNREGASGAGQGQGEWVWSASRVHPPSTVTVWEDDNPEVGRILGPKGQLLRVVRARKEKKVGFTVGDE